MLCRLRGFQIAVNLDIHVFALHDRDKESLSLFGNCVQKRGKTFNSITSTQLINLRLVISSISFNAGLEAYRRNDQPEIYELGRGYTVESLAPFLHAIAEKTQTFLVPVVQGKNMDIKVYGDLEAAKAAKHELGFVYFSE